MAASPVVPHAAFSSPPHRHDPSGTLAAWFTDPPGTVVQFTRPAVGSLPLVEWLLGPGREAMLARFPHEPLIVVMDLTLMTSRDPAVRPLLVEAAKGLKSRVARTVLIPPQNAKAVYLASLKVSTSLLAVFGVKVDIHASIAFAIRALKLSAASSGNAE